MEASNIKAMREALEKANEKRMADAVIQSLRDKKLEMAGEIAEKDEEIAGLRALVKDLSNVAERFVSCNATACEIACGDIKENCIHKKTIELVAKAAGESEVKDGCAPEIRR